MKNSHSYSGFSKRPTQNTAKQTYPRTDLACESGSTGENVPGTAYREYETYGLRITDLHVLNKEGERHTGQVRGRYTTLYCPIIRYWEMEQMEKTAAVLGALLRDYARIAVKETCRRRYQSTSGRAWKPVHYCGCCRAAYGGQNFCYQSYGGSGGRTAPKNGLLQHRRHPPGRKGTDGNRGCHYDPKCCGRCLPGHCYSRRCPGGPLH